MAIVFVSPREKQKTFLLIITVIFVLLLTMIGSGVFLAKPKPMPVEQAFLAPTIRINFDILKSDQVAQLEPMPQIEKEFSYQAQTKKGKAQTGKIIASSQDKAVKMLESLDLKVLAIEETKEGRENPFAPFYEINPVKKIK